MTAPDVAPPSPRRKPAMGAAATLAAALVLAVPVVTRHEGKRNVAYADVVGVSTECWGHAGPGVRLGERRTDAQCRTELAEDLRMTVEGIAPCIRVAVPAPSLAAFIDFSFNVGAPAFCSSSLARRLNGGDLRSACEGLTAWVWAGGRRVKGLVNRRAEERALCLKGVTG